MTTTETVIENDDKLEKEAELDSAAAIRVLKADFDDDGQMSSSNIQFMFDYISALEVALEFSAGAGLTQVESEIQAATEQGYALGSYVEEAINEQSAAK